MPSFQCVDLYIHEILNVILFLLCGRRHHDDQTCLIGTVSVLFEYQLVSMEQEGKSHFLFPLRSCN